MPPVTKSPFHRGQFVTYITNIRHPYGRVRAIVRRAHKDGTVTIESCHALDANGQPHCGYLGFRYRVAADVLSPVE